VRRTVRGLSAALSARTSGSHVRFVSTGTHSGSRTNRTDKFFPIGVSALPDTAFQLASRRPSCASVRRVRLGVPGHQLAIRPLVRSRGDSTLAPRGHPEGRPIVRRLRRSACASPQNQHTLPMLAWQLVKPKAPYCLM
jgi:hypothetical protein